MKNEILINVGGMTSRGLCPLMKHKGPSLNTAMASKT